MMLLVRKEVSFFFKDLIGLREFNMVDIKKIAKVFL